MNLYIFIKLLTFLQLFAYSQNSHVQDAKQRIRAEVRDALGPHHHHHHSRHSHLPMPHYHKHQQGPPWRNHQHVHRLYKWNGRRKPLNRHHYSRWTAWSACDHECVKQRERYCKLKRKCGHTKHVEQRKCKGCHPQPIMHEPLGIYPPWQPAPSNNMPQTIIINAGTTTTHATPATPSHDHHEHIRVPVLEEIEPPGYATIKPSFIHPETPLPTPFEQESEYNDSLSVTEDSQENEDDFFIAKGRSKFRKVANSIEMNEEDYKDLVTEEEQEPSDEFEDYQDGLFSTEQFKSLRHPRKKQQHRRHRQGRNQRFEGLRSRSLAPGDDGIDGDIFQYEDFDLPELGQTQDTQEGDSYEDEDYMDTRNASYVKANALMPRHRRLYTKWTRWSKCSPKCTTRRYKKCRVREQCGREVLREIAYCYTVGSFCQQWLRAHLQKSPPYEVRPVAASRRRDMSDGTQSNNAIEGDFIMNSKGYRGPEYTPQKLKCGIAAIRNNKRKMYNMLKIIGGKAARRGEWPWQVAIFNRFKEAFCGGTLIAPQWVLTAAHCVRKVLYVRIGEHNLDSDDGTEIQLRVLHSFKHPNFDKKTVDSDVALLKLPKPINTTTYIGFSCLPLPFQPLPKNIDCTVIGWGKRRNRDPVGTNVLHQAKVPIIPMDNCRSVYQDYTITKNMFCAGHKQGRIDTCAGDSGGPLLCRDTTKPNHPWTIFGITSFGDGCAKRNKFGIYAKVPNYVDWVWSVINCNGNCKQQQRLGY